MGFLVVGVGEVLLNFWEVIVDFLITASEENWILLGSEYRKIDPLNFAIKIIGL
jgi:hypothetical protein